MLHLYYHVGGGVFIFEGLCSIIYPVSVTLLDAPFILLLLLKLTQSAKISNTDPVTD